jgi:transcriptional regulator with XRE-family HTH domain
MSADALRAYIRTLRDGRKYTQERFAQSIGIGYRTLVDYELGETKSLRDSALVKAVGVLGASWDDVTDLVETELGAEEGERRARLILDKRDPIDTIVDSFPPGTDPQEAGRLVEEALDAIETDERRALIQGLRDWLHGWRSARAAARALR